MRLLVVGGSGMLGTDLRKELGRRGFDCVAPTSAELDITDPESAAQVAASAFGAIDWCVNCAGYTAVDQAEGEPQRAHELNALGPGYLARACLMAGAKILHVSTDFVFDGRATEPYTEDSPTGPLGVYGRTKLEGERAVMESNQHGVIARTSWLYGANGKSFPRTIIRAWEAGKELRVVADQVGCPTYTVDLARVLVDLVERSAFPGIYHTAGPEAMSWHQFATMTIEEYAKAVGEEPGTIVAISTSEWPTPAKRPANSALSFAKAASLGIAPMRPVRESIREFVREVAVLEHAASGD